MLLEPGRVCIKKYGRDAGSNAVVTKAAKDGFVMIITAKRNKERKCNVNHLEFLNETIDIKDTEKLNKLLNIKPKTAETKPQRKK
jgi:ribosomal protein L14E/L6E/L27E